MSEKIIELILQNPSGFETEKIIINNRNYEVSYEWKRRINIEIKPAQQLFQDIAISEIEKNNFMIFITRSPSYSLRGTRTALTENLLSNKYTPALLSFPASKISCENNQVSYTAKLRKKNSDQLIKIVNYFEALIRTL